MYILRDNEIECHECGRIYENNTECPGCADEEDRRASKEAEEQAKFEANEEAISEIVSEIEEKLDDANMDYDVHYARSGSVYISVDIEDGNDSVTIRISDHEQVDGGGFNEVSRMRSGEADFDLFLKSGRTAQDALNFVNAA